MPNWLVHPFGIDPAFWLAYLTNGKHLAWYASVVFNLAAAILGGLFALAFGLAGATLRRSRLWPLRLLASGYANIVRGVPDVLFFLFFPLAFEQLLELLIASQVCTPESIAASSSRWPPCRAANVLFSTNGYLLLASLSLGLVYGAFASSAIHGAFDAVAKGQLEAARAFGMSERQVLWRIHIRQMWIYALPGLSNAWMLLVKSTSLLSLLQIPDMVYWAERLGAPNFLPRVGFVHTDWRWAYYFALLLLYVAITFVSERFFRGLRRKAGHGLISAED
jgi:polar amino acid transport system permease protein